MTHISFRGADMVTIKQPWNKRTVIRCNFGMWRAWVPNPCSRM